MNVLCHKGIDMFSELSIKSITISPELITSYLANESTDFAGSYVENFDPQLAQRLHDDSFEVLEAEPPQHPIKSVMKKLENQHQARQMWTKNSGVLPVVVNPRNNAVTCPGVEICGCVCATGWKQGAGEGLGTPSSSDYRAGFAFVPYIKSDLYERFTYSAGGGGVGDQSCHVTPETKAMVNSYLGKCMQMASLILERIRNPMMARHMQPLYHQMCEASFGQGIEGKLLQLLTRAATLPASYGQEYFNKVHRVFMDNIALFKAVQQDQVIWSMPYKCSYKNIVDTVLENVKCGQRRSLKVLEVSASFNHCYGLRFGQIMKEYYPGCSVEYEIASVLDDPNQRVS